MGYRLLQACIKLLWRSCMSHALLLLCCRIGFLKVHQVITQPLQGCVRCQWLTGPLANQLASYSNAFHKAFAWQWVRWSDFNKCAISLLKFIDIEVIEICACWPNACFSTVVTSRQTTIFCLRQSIGSYQKWTDGTNRNQWKVIRNAQMEQTEIKEKLWEMQPGSQQKSMKSYQKCSR